MEQSNPLSPPSPSTPHPLYDARETEGVGRSPSDSTLPKGDEGDEGASTWWDSLSVSSFFEVSYIHVPILPTLPTLVPTFVPTLLSRDKLHPCTNTTNTRTNEFVVTTVLMNELSNEYL